jgi:diguanylate cyclase (GGDEF)-like protein
LERANRAIEFRKKIRPGYGFSVLFVDLDKFKLINDTLGHLAGDKFLALIARRMQHSIKSSDIVARMGGDEFAILLSDLKESDEVLEIANHLLENISKPVDLNGHEIFPGASIGIALSTPAYRDAEEILRDADMAMYEAKSKGRGRFEIFDDSLQRKAIQELQLDADLRRAIERHEFCLYFQPIIALKERRLIGFEALIRWHHPEKGLLSPIAFIETLEEKNLIFKVGHWVIEEVCRQLYLWRQIDSGVADLSVSINLSSKQLTDHQFSAKVQKLLQVYQLSGQALKMEVTEGSIMDRSQVPMQNFRFLKELGVEIHIDDFGTGYSSLSYLHEFSIDALKIDRAFIAEIDKKPDDAIGFSVTRSIIGLAHNLGVKVVAEGIQNVHHLTYLIRSGCDYGQGYLLSPPLNVSDATELLHQGWQWHWSI